MFSLSAATAVVCHSRGAISRTQCSPPRWSSSVSVASSSYLGQTLTLRARKGIRSQSSRQVQPIQASFFGVGAPEAILVGVVALLVFGPKGLAQAAKSLGETLRAFQPTIRELTQVSSELKSSLETEIGLNEIREELRRPPTPTVRSTDEEGTAGMQGSGLSDLANDMTSKVKETREGMARMVDPEIERKRQESAKLAWGASEGAGAAATAAAPAAPSSSGGGASTSSAEPTPVSSSGGSGSPTAAPSPPQGGASAAAAPPSPSAPQLNDLTLEQLEAELQRRKAAAAAQQVPKELRADD